MLKKVKEAASKLFKRQPKEAKKEHKTTQHKREPHIIHSDDCTGFAFTTEGEYAGDYVVFERAFPHANTMIDAELLLEVISTYGKDVRRLAKRSEAKRLAKQRSK